MIDYDEDKKEPLHKNFFVKVIFIGLLVGVLYFIMSPYQNCMRKTDNNNVFCVNRTNW
jgi:hypothetical protein